MQKSNNAKETVSNSKSIAQGVERRHPMSQHSFLAENQFLQSCPYNALEWAENSGQHSTFTTRWIGGRPVDDCAFNNQGCRLLVTGLGSNPRHGRPLLWVWAPHNYPTSYRLINPQAGRKCYFIQWESGKKRSSNDIQNQNKIVEW